MFDKLYYCTNLKLREDSVIEKGSSPIDEEKGVPFGYGKLSEKYTIIELILEIVRLEECPQKPKRSKSLFTFKDLRALEDFVYKYRSRTGIYCYEVQPINETYNYHIGDYMYHGLIEYIENDSNWEKLRYKDFRNYGTLYWLKKPADETAEVVIESPIRIIKEIQIDY